MTHLLETGRCRPHRGDVQAYQDNHIAGGIISRHGRAELSHHRSRRHSDYAFRYRAVFPLR
jgi:hypothetical protein